MAQHCYTLTLPRGTLPHNGIAPQGIQPRSCIAPQGTQPHICMSPLGPAPQLDNGTTQRGPSPLMVSFHRVLVPQQRRVLQGARYLQ